MLKISMFGSCQLTDNGVVLKTFSQPRAQTLLAYLLLHSGVMERSACAQRLWPDSSESQARTNLRRELHQLRGVHPTISESLIVNRQTLCWQRSDTCQSDSDLFREQVKKFFDSEKSAERLIAALKVMEIHTAPLLQAVNDEWLSTYRQDFAEQWRILSEWLVQQYLRDNKWSEADALLNRLLFFDRLNESTQELLMRLCLESGRVSDAIRVYDRYAEQLNNELGVRPSAKLNHLYDAAKNDSITSAKETRVRTRPEVDTASRRSFVFQSAQSPLVGRVVELQMLREAWQKIVRKPRLILLEGDPGIGKTRLAHEFMKTVVAVPEQRVAARCSHIEYAIPFSPLAEWLDFKPLKSAVMSLKPVLKNELCKLFPEIVDASDITVYDNEHSLSRAHLFKALNGVFDCQN